MKTSLLKLVLLNFLIFNGLSDAKAQLTAQQTVKKQVAGEASIERLKQVSPEFAKITEEILYKDIWNRPGLSSRDKSLITISILIATGRQDQAEGHIRRGLDNGLTKEEIKSAMTHIAFYAGWPAGVTGLQLFKNVLDKETKK